MMKIARQAPDSPSFDRKGGSEEPKTDANASSFASVLMHLEAHTRQQHLPQPASFQTRSFTNRPEQDARSNFETALSRRERIDFPSPPPNVPARSRPPHVADPPVHLDRAQPRTATWEAGRSTEQASPADRGEPTTPQDRPEVDDPARAATSRGNHEDPNGPTQDDPRQVKQAETSSTTNEQSRSQSGPSGQMEGVAGQSAAVGAEVGPTQKQATPSAAAATTTERHAANGSPQVATSSPQGDAAKARPQQDPRFGGAVTHSTAAKSPTGVASDHNGPTTAGPTTDGDPGHENPAITPSGESALTGGALGGTHPGPGAPPTTTLDPSNPAVRPVNTPTAPQSAAPAEQLAPSAPLPRTPATLERIEDIGRVLERMRPIPRGGAIVDLKAPGLGNLQLRVEPLDEGFRIAIRTTNLSATASLEAERSTLMGTLSRALESGTDLTLDIETRGDNRRQASDFQQSRSGDDPRPHSEPQGPRPATANPSPANPPPRSAARGLVDIVV